MRLSGLSQFSVSDLSILHILAENEQAGAEGGIGVGNLKNMDTPIAKALKATGSSQQDTAKRLGIHPSTLSRYKHPRSPDKDEGSRRPGFKRLKEISQKVGDITTVFPELS